MIFNHLDLKHLILLKDKVIFVKIDGGGRLKDMERFDNFIFAKIFCEDLEKRRFKTKIVLVPATMADRYEHRHDIYERLF